MAVNEREAAIAAVEERWRMVSIEPLRFVGETLPSTTNSEAIRRLYDTIEELAVHLAIDVRPGFADRVDRVRDKLLETIERELKAFAVDLVVDEAYQAQECVA